MYNNTMKTVKFYPKPAIPPYIFYIFYFVISLLTLTLFPIVHSDELWLGELSSTYLSHHTIYLTEPFFDLFPRQTHTLKLLFHLIQMPFIALGGLNIFSLRLISLLFATFSLYLLHQYIDQQFSMVVHTYPLVMVLGFNVQFIYASHFARQEIILFFILIMVYYIYHQPSYALNLRILLIGTLIGAAIGIHPNAFMLAMMMGLFFLTECALSHLKIRHLILYGATLLLFALFYLATSFINNPDFLTNYLAYGESLSLPATHAHPLTFLYQFYYKLYHQIGATYYLPNIKLFFLLTFFLITILFLLFFFKKKKPFSWHPFLPSLSLLVGFNLSLLIVGRYNPTSILLILFPFFLLFVQLIHHLSPLIPSSITRLSLALLLVVLLINSYQAYTDHAHHTFTDYTHSLASHLSPDAIILGNLSGAFAFKNHTFYDIRNLHYLDQETVAEYIDRHHINTIIYYEAYDYIHNNPKWQILYGSDQNYYAALNQFIYDRGTLTYTFTDTYYGIRILDYTKDYPWEIRIYTILPVNE